MVKVDASPWMPAAGHARRGSVPRSPPRRAAGRARTGPPRPRLPLYVTFSTEACLRAEAPERPSRAQTSVSGGLRARPASGGPSAFHPCRGGGQPRGRPVPTSRPGHRRCWPPGPPGRRGGVRAAGPSAPSGHAAAQDRAALSCLARAVPCALLPPSLPPASVTRQDSRGAADSAALSSQLRTRPLCRVRPPSPLVP